MTLPFHLNYLDLFILALLAVFILDGVSRGFLGEVAALAGLVGGVVLAGKFYAPLGAALTAHIPGGTWPYVLAYVLILAATMLIAGLIARVLRKLLNLACVGWINHLAGALTGGLKGFLICAVLVGLLKHFLGTEPYVRLSRLVPLIARLTEYLKEYLPHTIQQFL